MQRYRYTFLYICLCEQQQQVPPLHTRLDTFNDSSAAIQHIAEIPPTLETIPCKPLFFDLAFNDVVAPDLTERLAPKQQKRGGLFGFLRR